MGNIPRLFTTTQTADIFGLNKQTLEKFRREGEGPRFIRIGRKVFYRLTDIESFLEANTIGAE